MRTKNEIYDLIRDAMYDAMDMEWNKLSEQEKKAYRLNIHGIEMYISKTQN